MFASLHQKAECDSSCEEMLLSAHVFFRFWVWRRITIGSRTPQFGLPVGGIASITTKCIQYVQYTAWRRERSHRTGFWISQHWLLIVILKQHLTFAQKFCKKQNKINNQEPYQTLKKWKKIRVKIKTSPQYWYVTKQRGWQCFYVPKKQVLFFFSVHIINKSAWKMHFLCKHLLA